MPDALEWLVEYGSPDDIGSAYDHFDTIEKATDYLRGLARQGKTATLYQRVPFEVQIGVTVRAPRKRRKTPPPADKPGSDTPTGPGNGEAGELKDIGAASPQAAEKETGSGQSTPPSTASNLASPVFPWTCEARFDGDPLCPGHVERDPVTGGWFCDLHLTAIAASCRREMHRRHASRNRPVRVAHAG